MPKSAVKSSRFHLAFVAASSLALGACGGIDGVELNGGVFDAMGIGSNSARDKEPVVPQRAGLVMPPTTAALPAPGAQANDVSVAAANPAWPVDPEERRRQQTAAVRQQHDAWCTKELQRKKVMGDETSTEGPLGRCDPSILKLFGSTGEIKEQRAEEFRTR